MREINAARKQVRAFLIDICELAFDPTVKAFFFYPSLNVAIIGANAFSQ